MRTPRRIQQKMFYSQPDEKITAYKRDKDGNIIYDVKTHLPLKTGENRVGYGEAIEFRNSITADLTADELAAFGADANSKAKLTYRNGEYSFMTGTRIWRTSEVEYIGGNVNEKTADYEVVKVIKGRNFTRCLLKEIVK